MNDSQIATLVKLVGYIASHTGKEPRCDGQRNFAWDEASIGLTPGGTSGVKLHLDTTNELSDLHLLLTTFCQSLGVDCTFG